jgi:hypothetical protein
MSTSSDEPDTPAEARVRQLLEPLRGDGPEPPEALMPRLLRTVRWQRTARELLQAAGALAAAVGDGLRVVAGSGENRS